MKASAESEVPTPMPARYRAASRDLTPIRDAATDRRRKPSFPPIFDFARTYHPEQTTERLILTVATHPSRPSHADEEMPSPTVIDGTP